MAICKLDDLGFKLPPFTWANNQPNNMYVTLGNNVTFSILNIIIQNGNLDYFNHTYICLIPKINAPSTPSDFKPISLCNVMLKILTKTIASRIKDVLDTIIKFFYSAFVPNILIRDNAILCYECLHHIIIFK